MEENEASSSLHQQVVLKTQELHDMTDMENQEVKDIIKIGFTPSFFLQPHYILQQFLRPFFQGKLASHTLLFINMHFSNLGMCIHGALF